MSSTSQMMSEYILEVKHAEVHMKRHSCIFKGYSSLCDQYIDECKGVSH